MAKFDAAQFEALWDNAKKQPGFRQADMKPIQIDLSLSGILDQYLAMAAKYRDQGRIGRIDYDALALAIAALKAVLARINDSLLVADAVSQNAAAIKQQVDEKAGKLLP